jgi:hypothetical protein
VGLKDGMKGMAVGLGLTKRGWSTGTTTGLEDELGEAVGERLGRGDVVGRGERLG